MKLAFVSDIHEDVVSLRIAMQKIEKAKPDQIICLGDISGYNAIHYNYINTRNAHECLNIIRANCSIILLGNHDFNAIRKIPDFSPGFDYPQNWYDLDYYEKKHIANNRLWSYDDAELNPKYKTNDVAFLKSLNQVEILEVENQKLLLSHYVYPNITGILVDYLIKREDFDAHFNYMRTHDCSISINGHEHTPGLCYVTQQHIKIKSFGRKQFQGTPLILMCPSIANGRNKNGFLLFDTQTLKAEAKRL